MFGAKVFSTIDLKDAYHHVKLTDRAKELTAFSTFLGHFQWKFCKFGFKNSGASLCRLLTMILTGCIGKYVQMYVDDILVFSNSIEEHFTHIREVLSRIDKANLCINPKKYTFFCKSVEFLGQRLTQSCIYIIESHIDSVRNFLS